MIWIKIQKDSDKPEYDGFIIYVPSFISLPQQESIYVNFGNLRKKAQIEWVQSELPVHTTWSSPMTIRFSEPLLDGLYIKDELTYKLLIRNGEIFIGPVIGLLLGEQHYYYHHRYMHEYTDAVGSYHQVGGLVIAFKECSIDWENHCLFGLYYHPKAKQWKYGKLPIPSIIYRRGYKLNQNIAEKLAKVTNNNVFNSFRYEKWGLYQYLVTHKEFEEYLPETIKLYTPKDVITALQVKQKIILKPSDLSRGRGIYILKSHSPESILVVDYNEGDKKELLIPKWAIEDYLLQENLTSKNYIIQPFINLAKIDGSPWDIRVVMQKNVKFEWHCSGIECRVAGQNQFVTNISRGGSALPIKEALELSFGSSVPASLLKNKVISTAKEFCKIMDQTGEHFAEFGLDLAFDENQKLWFIEANMRPTFNGFKKMNMSNYYYICQNPLRYAAAVDGF